MLNMRKTFRFFPIALLVLGFVRSPATEQVISIPSGVGNTLTLYPMRIEEDWTVSMRYQQVYAASAFAALAPTNYYITRIDFLVDETADEGVMGTTTNLEIRVSTTAKAPDALSTIFADNIGPDEMLVYADTEPMYIRPNLRLDRYIFVLPEPFRYEPARGNLLLDLSVQTTGMPLPTEIPVALDANNDSTDGVSRVYAKSIDSAQATASDTIGLNTIFHFNPVPSLQLRIENVFGTNRPVLRWSAQPSVFTLQVAAELASGASWHTITNDIGGSPLGPDRSIYLPVTPSGPSAFYRLIWEGVKSHQPAAVDVEHPRLAQPRPKE